MDWREGTSLSLDELDTVLAGDGEDEDDMLHYLNSDLSHRSLALAHGRTRAFGRSPQRGTGTVAYSPKRSHIEAFNALLSSGSPMKRVSPARVSGASTPLTRKLLSTNGVFAAGSEACFRGTRGSIIPLVSPSNCFMPGTARAIAAAAAGGESEDALLAAAESSDLLAFFPTPNASPMPQRSAMTLGGSAGCAAFSARASPLRRATAIQDGGAQSQSQTPSDRDCPIRRSPYREQQLAKTAAAAASSSAHAQASSLLSPATRRPMPPFAPPGAQPACPPPRTPVPTSAPSARHHAPDQHGSPADERGGAVGSWSQRLCTPSVGTQPQTDADGTMVTPGQLGAHGTPTGAREGSGKASQLFGRRINFAPMTPAGQRTAACTALKRVAVFGATQTPTAAKAVGGGGGGSGVWASPGSAGALASLSKINLMLNQNALARTDARSPSRTAWGAAAVSPGTADSRALAFLAHEELLPDDGGGECFGFGGPLRVDDLVDPSLIPHVPTEASTVGRHNPLMPAEMCTDQLPVPTAPNCPILVVRTRSVSMHQAVHSGRPTAAVEPQLAAAKGERPAACLVDVAPVLRREGSSANDISVASTAVLTPRLAGHAEQLHALAAEVADAVGHDGAAPACARSAPTAARADGSGGFTYKFGAVRRDGAPHAHKEAPLATAATTRALRRDAQSPSRAEPSGAAAGSQRAPAGINARINFTVVENGQWTRSARTGRTTE